jgi:hypothetical protein
MTRKSDRDTVRWVAHYYEMDRDSLIREGRIRAAVDDGAITPELAAGLYLRTADKLDW